MHLQDKLSGNGRSHLSGNGRSRLMYSHSKENAR